MAKDNLTKETNIDVTARELDFVTRFGRNWKHLQEIMGIMRAIKKEPGAVLKSKYAEVTLQSGEVGEGEDIPYSLAEVKEKAYAEMDIEKYAKAVSIEAIKTYGYDVAVAMTDEQFLFELQNNVTGRFYNYLKTGTLASSETTWQMALAMAQGRVINRFKEMHRTATKIVGFVNTLDVYKYLGAADISVQSEFGLNYVKNFMGYDTLFLTSEIPAGTVIATPVENIVLYYVDPGDSDFAKAGLEYRTDGETNLIGFHVQGNYGTAVSESFALMGLVLFAEYLDAIAVVSVDTTPTLGSLTVSSVAGTTAGDTKISVAEDKEFASDEYRYKVATAAVDVTYGMNVSKWTKWDGESDITAASGKVITVVECDGAGKALAEGHATVVAAS